MSRRRASVWFAGQWGTFWVTTGGGERKGAGSRPWLIPGGVSGSVSLQEALPPLTSPSHMGAQCWVVSSCSEELISSQTDGTVARADLERKDEPGVSRQGAAGGRRKREEHGGQPGGASEVMHSIGQGS